MVNHRFRDVASGLAQTFPMPEASWLPIVIDEPRVQLGSFLVLALIAIAAAVLARTPAGYRMRMTGLNPRFARYGGVDLPKLGFRVLFLSGAIAGVVGAIATFKMQHLGEL
jgi:simple sugar transport system permease protein